MTDQKLRGLERRYRETGTVEDEAAWLLERVRAGELERGRLELAAFLSSPAACMAVPTFRLEDRLHGFFIEVWGREAGSRALLAASQPVLCLWEAGAKELWPERSWQDMRVALEASEDCTLCPCAACAERACGAGWQLHALAGELAEQLPADHYLSQAAFAVASSAFCIGEDELDDHSDMEVLTFLGQLATAPPYGRIQEPMSSISAELVPWALGYSDPVKERVEARQRETP